MLKTLSSPFDLLLCRPGSTDLLQRELEECHGVHSRIVSPGLLQLDSGTAPTAPCMFEAQRVPSARFYPLEKGDRIPDEVCEAVWTSWAETPRPWGAHSLTPEGEGPRETGRLRGVARELVRKGNRLHPGLAKWERDPAKLFAADKGCIQQWVLAPEGLFFGTAAPSALSSSAPGGRFRMKMDPAAPSRSYLKIEEAFARMGREPAEGETAIDLGAAPGGWSYALARRGCHVTAVDNGPLKIKDASVRRIEHLHADGLRFRLSRRQPAVDWLVADMLVPPGKGFGVLRHWIGDRKCSHLVFNLKLPQGEPIAALLPVRDWLSQFNELQIRQLYHDRREVTVFGSITS